MRAPEEIRVQRSQQFFQSAAVRLALHVLGHHGDHAVLDRGEADFFLVDEKETVVGLEQNLSGLRLLLLQQFDQGVQFFAGGYVGLLRLAGFLDGLKDALLVERLQDIVQRADLKGLYRILIKGGGERRYWATESSSPAAS